MDFVCPYLILEVIHISKYIFGRKGWKNPDSKYAYADDDQLDKDIHNSIVRHDNKKKHIEELFINEIRNDPTRQDETFNMFIDVLREWKLNNQ